jgi:cytoskeletal protein RodZ
MKKRYLMIMVMSIALGLSGCGGSGGGTTTTQEETNSTTPNSSDTSQETNNTTSKTPEGTNNTTSKTPEGTNNTTSKTPERTNTSTPPSTVVGKVTIEVQCTTPPSISDYLELQSGDKIIKESEDSVVKIYHDENNLKYVCLESGQVYVERSE